MGAAKEILTTVASGKFLNAINIAIKAINPKKHLKKCETELERYLNQNKEDESNN